MHTLPQDELTFNGPHESMGSEMTDSEPDFLSSKNIPPQERLIVALDVPTIEEAKSHVEALGDSVHFYKVGLQLFMTGGYFPFVDWLRERGKNVFVDLKFFDVPQTVAKAVKQLQGRGVTFATVHGNDDILRYAGEAKGDVKILAVTALTSLDQADMRDLGFSCAIPDLVLSRARRALENGCDGVISSGLEARRLRESIDDKLLVITPGVRGFSNAADQSRPADDQKRTVTVEDAFRSGADYIVVGRPILGAENPAASAREHQERIQSLFV